MLERLQSYGLVKIFDVQASLMISLVGLIVVLTCHRCVQVPSIDFSLPAAL
jgi:hypothetical protein